MSDRTVRVSLELLNSQYERAALQSAGTTKTLDRNVKDLNESTLDGARDLKVLATEVNSTDRRVAELGRDAAKTAAELELLNHESDKVSEKVAGLGKESGKTAGDVRHLDAEIARVKTTVRELAQEFDRTGNTDLLGKISKQRSGLGLLTAMRKELADAAKEAETGGGQVARKLNTALSDGLADAASGIPFGVGAAFKAAAANPELAAAGAAIAAPLAAGLAAALGGATLAATAAAGLAGGIFLAAGSREVHQAWAEFGHTALQELQNASGPLVEPLTRAAHTIGDAVHAEIPALQKDFASLAPTVDHLATGLSGLIREMDPGFSHAMQAGADVLSRVADELPDVGHAFGFMFDEIAAGSAGGGSALITTLTAAEFTIELLGSSIHDASVAFELFSGPLALVTDKLGGMDVAARLLTGSGILHLVEALTENDDKNKAVANSTDDLFHKFEAAAEGAKKQADEEHRLADEARYAKQALKELQDFVSSQANVILGAQQAQLSFNQSLITMHDTLKANKDAFDEHSQAGIKDREVVIASAQAAVQLRNDTLALTGSTELADTAFQGAIKQVRDLGHAMGLSDAQIDSVIGSLRDLHSPPPIIVDLKRLGYTDGQIENLKEQIGQLHNKLTTIQIDYISRHIDVFGTNPGAGQGRFGGQAAGGPAPVGVPYWVGEKGPELRFDTQPGHIMNNADSMRYVGASAGRSTGGAAGGNTYNINLNAGPGANGAALGAEVIKMIKQYEQSNGAGWRR